MTKVYLRALSMDDLDFTHKWHSDETLYNTLGGIFRYVSKDAEKEWLQNKVKYSNQEINLMICLVENDQPIGMVSVRDIDWITRIGYLSGIFIGEKDQQRKGFGTEALKMMMDHCYRDLGLNRIYAHILEENDSSLKSFKKCGFQIEGHLKQHALKNGQFRDVVVVGLCADQYFSMKVQ